MTAQGTCNCALEVVLLESRDIIGQLLLEKEERYSVAVHCKAQYYAIGVIFGLFGCRCAPKANDSADSTEG